MKLDDIIIEVRDKNLTRLGQFTPEDLVGFTAVLRYNAVGSWKAVLPVGSKMGELLRQPSSGIIITTPQGVLLSGSTISVLTTQSTSDPIGTYEITGVDDSVLLTERLAYPTPTTADVSAQTQAYDVREGTAETVIKQYVDANMGAAAPEERRVYGLTVEASQERGQSVSGSARFQTLQELVQPLADLAGLGYTIEQNEDVLEFQIFEPVDRSGNIRLDLQNGMLSRSDYSYAQPKATRIIVGGQGEDEARTFIERSNDTSIDAEDAWARRIEVFEDQRSTAELEKLQQAADETLVKDGKSLISVRISPSDAESMLYGVDWNLGDKVTCVVGDVEIQAVVTEVGLSIDVDGVRIAATVGEPRSLDYETQILTRQTQHNVRLSKLERT